jgi:hypothetical protein
LAKLKTSYGPPIIAIINWGTAGILLLSGVKSIGGLPMFGSLGILSAGYFPAGIFSAGIFSAGIVSVGVLSIGIISIGIVSIGVFNIGVWSIGLYAWTVYMGVKAVRRSKKKKELITAVDCSETGHS